MPGIVWQPEIYVQSESRRPSSISVAAFAGAGWRYIHVPERVLAKTLKEQFDWVGWCIQDHYQKSKGECFLFGKITGYAYRPRREDYIKFDVGGNLVMDETR